MVLGGETVSPVGQELIGSFRPVHGVKAVPFGTGLGVASRVLFNRSLDGRDGSVQGGFSGPYGQQTLRNVFLDASDCSGAIPDARGRESVGSGGLATESTILVLAQTCR